MSGDIHLVRSGIAAIILAQYIAQIEEFEAMSRKQRRTPRGRDLADRIDGLREGREKWQRSLDAARAREGKNLPQPPENVPN